METIECIRTRASVRKFRQEPVPEESVKEILEAAIQSPSAGNTQEWHFVVVTRPEYRKQGAEAAFGQDFVAQAPLVIVVCADLDRIGAAYGERGVTLYALQDTAAAIQSLMLAAWERGVASCWVGAFNEARLKGVLVIPTNVKPVAIIPMGYPAEKPKKPERRPLEEVMHRERWA